MKKNKILIIAPYGMTLRQIILNKELWAYLVSEYEIHVKTPLSIENSNELGINKIINPEYATSGKRLLKSVVSRMHWAVKVTGIIEFQIENNLGEHLIFRLRNNYINIHASFKNYLMCMVASIVNIFGGLNGRLAWFYSLLSVVRDEDYKFILVTHISEFESEVEAIAANMLNRSVITYTLGMDNYRHGRLLFKPDLMLLWGEEHKYEFRAWHKSDFDTIDDIRHEVVGNLIYDTYLQPANRDKFQHSNFYQKIAQYDGYILVPAMIESVIPGQTQLILSLVQYLKTRNFNYLIVVRILPGTDKEMWTDFQEKNMDHVFVYEPTAGSFDKRGLIRTFSLQSELEEVAVFSGQLESANLVVNLYPTTVTLDAYLFGTPTILPLFDWREEDGDRLSEHPYSKIVLAKLATHPHNAEFNCVYSYGDFYCALDDIFLKGQKSKYVGTRLFERVCGQSNDEHVGDRAVKAIDDFMHSVEVV